MFSSFFGPVSTVWISCSMAIFSMIMFRVSPTMCLRLPPAVLQIW